MLALSDPTLNRKKRQKLIKEAYSKINDEVSSIKELSIKSSPLSFYWENSEDQRNKKQLENLLSTENRYLEDRDANIVKKFLINHPRKYEEKYQEFLSELLVADRASDYGIPKSSERKDIAYEYINTCIIYLTVDAKVKWLEYCIENKLFTNKTLTKFKLEVYTKCDALKTEEGRILSEICIDNDYGTLQKILDEELKSEAINPPAEWENYRLSISRTELELLNEKMQTGEPFYVYRGFLVDKDEYVRAGKKSSGADYWKQVGGQGLSYSLNKNIAIYFAYWNLSHNDKGEIVNDVPLGKLRNSKMPNCLISKDEWIEEATQEIYQLRENKINNQRKPIICKYLVDPNDIKGYNIKTGEGEIIIKPENVVIENYTILSSKQMAEGVYNWSYRNIEDWNSLTALYNRKGVVVLPQTNEDMSEVWFYFANAEDVNPVIDRIKNRIKKGGLFTNSKFTNQDLQEIVQTFANHAIEVPREFEINPRFFTKDTEALLSSKRTKLKKRAGKFYDWSKVALQKYLAKS